MRLRKGKAVEVIGGKVQLGEWTAGEYVRKVQGRDDLGRPYLIDVNGRLTRFSRDEIREPRQEE